MGNRIEPVSLEDASDDIRELLRQTAADGVAPDGLPGDFYPSIAHVPGGAANFHRMVMRISGDDRPLPATLRELVALRQAIVSDCRSSFVQHVAAARAVGLAEEKISAIKGWTTSDLYDETERAVMAATDELISVGRIQDETIAAMKRHLTDEAIAEVVYAAAVYDMVSTLVRGLHLGDDTDISDRLVEVPKFEGS